VSDLSLGHEDRGRKVSVLTGDRILLRLPENPTTGFRWAGPIPDFLTTLRDDNESGAGPGAAGVRVIEFIAAAAGSAELTLRCSREWDLAATPIDQFSVSVEVKEA
jgi:inhibitor of cysteine peptidase